MASKLLSGQGFKEVYNLEGGIYAWNGLTAKGPKEFHLKLIKKDASPEQMILLAYEMEEALRQFYLEAQKTITDQELAETFSRLAAAEEQHKKSILDMCLKIGVITASAKNTPVEIMEGGFDTNEFFRQNQEPLKTLTGTLALSMMVETQLLDLYLWLAQEVRDKTVQEFLLALGDIEKEHLKSLAQLFEKKR